LTYNSLLHIFLRLARDRGLAVAAWRMPYDSDYQLMLGNPVACPGNIFSHSGRKKGFLFAPFDKNSANKAYFFEELAKFNSGNGKLYHREGLKREATSYIEKSVKKPVFSVDEDILQSNTFWTSTPKEHFTDGVDEIIKTIKSGNLRKVVLSGRKHIRFSTYPDLEIIWKNITNRYHRAFISMVYTPDGQLWAGASPELLLSVNRDYIRTIALAGTQNGQSGTAISWSEKDRTEQQIVCDYIEECFENAEIGNVEISPVKTAIAGQLKHLQTEYFAPVNDNINKLDTLVNFLHPTPAVCGVPLGKAKSLIKQYEEGPREYYSGYLGPVGYNGSYNLFVNLRCMQLSNQGALLYAGSGIVQDSDPDAEWNEIQMKFGTMLSELSPLLV
jgi:isochorismate synthase